MKVASFKAKRKHGYCNKWFGGKLPSTARRALKRWTEMKVPNNMKICGNIYGHYFNFKIANAIHVTKRKGRTDFFDTYTRNAYNVLKDIFREKFLDVIKKEVSKAEKPSWVHPVVSHNQVKVSLLKTRLEKSVNNGGCTFLHNFLSVVVAGTFPKNNSSRSDGSRQRYPLTTSGKLVIFTPTLVILPKIISTTKSRLSLSTSQWKKRFCSWT
jgi:hypothetical protein